MAKDLTDPEEANSAGVTRDLTNKIEAGKLPESAYQKILRTIKEAVGLGVISPEAASDVRAGTLGRQRPDGSRSGEGTPPVL